MIRVYVVDDEKLVRRGIIGLIDWAKYDMTVVGDSGNGAETLEFLRSHEVDILFSDLEMPGLSGIPFLLKVKELCPQIKIVVLTMHQEFEIIQQALRLGILDYITKAQIEEENADALMANIRKRYLETLHHSWLEERRSETNETFIWQLDDREAEERAELMLMEEHFPFVKLSDHALLFPGDCNSIRLKALAEKFDDKDTTLVELKQIKDTRFDKLEEIMNAQVKQKLFKDRRPGCISYSYSYPALAETPPGITRQEVMELCTQMAFMTNPECYKKGMERIRDANLSLEERRAVFYQFNLHWSEFSGKEIGRYFEEVEKFRWWYQWREWFDEVRGMVLTQIGGTDAEATAMEAIHKAMLHIRKHMDRELPLEELLKLTGMSKSHFSRNFKKVTGKTFVTWLNDARIDSAKKYLTETNQPVWWIAKQVGYEDEHYFRRIFKERTGESPRSFRDNAQKSI